MIVNLLLLAALICFIIAASWPMGPPHHGRLVPLGLALAAASALILRGGLI